MPDKLKTELADEHTTNLAYQNDDPDQKEYSEDLAPPDTQDSYIYGDADATEEDTLETMTVYDPDGERFEELEDNPSPDESIVCYSYSRKTGQPIETLAIDEVRRTLTNSNQFIWLGQYNLLFLGYKGKLISIFCVDIPLRDEAGAVLAELRNRGKKVVLLTGDNELRTKKILKDVTFDEVHTSMTPVTKFEYIKSEKEQGRHVLMIGDGLNDSAALSESDVSIVMSESADLSKQISDVVLKSDSLNSLLLLSDVSKTLRAQMSNNVKSTVSINSSLIFLGLINVLPSNLLALLHNLTTFSIVLKNFNIK